MLVLRHRGVTVVVPLWAGLDIRHEHLDDVFGIHLASPCHLTSEMVCKCESVSNVESRRTKIWEVLPVLHLSGNTNARGVCFEL